MVRDGVWAPASGMQFDGHHPYSVDARSLSSLNPGELEEVMWSGTRIVLSNRGADDGR